MPDPRLIASVRINLAGIPGGLQRKLQALTNRVAFGLLASEQFTPVELELPDVALRLRLSNREELWDETRIRSDFKHWTVASGLRDAVEAFAVVLEEARSVCAAWTLSRDSDRVAIEDWNEKLVTEPVRFDRRGFPDKLRFLREEYEVSLPEDKERDILSLSRARNCLVHRGGRVALRDLAVPDSEAREAITAYRTAHPTEPWSVERSRDALSARGISPAMAVTWLKIQPIAEIDGAITDLDPRESPFVPAGAELGVQVQRATREFLLGEVVTLSANDFAGMCFAFFNAGRTLADALEERGRALGVQFTEEPAANSDEYLGVGEEEVIEKKEDRSGRGNLGWDEIMPSGQILASPPPSREDPSSMFRGHVIGDGQENEPEATGTDRKALGPRSNKTGNNA